MNYKEKILHPKWQRKRLEIMQRDDFKCSYCKDEENTLHVHHIVYPESGNPWDSGNDDLITLCKTCHEEESDKERGKNAVLEFFSEIYNLPVLKTFSLTESLSIWLYLGRGSKKELILYILQEIIDDINSGKTRLK
jgi:hypothetical protein